MHCIIRTIFAWMIMAMSLLPWHLQGQESTTLFSKAEIEQMVAPIALYPDPLLAQIFMASTYPIEIITASAWMKSNPNLTGKALEDALVKQPWDASVKSLTTVPDVLNMMNEKLEFTQRLGDAFLAQQNDVMNAVQTLRYRAQAAGHLESSPEQIVTATQDTITIEPADPQYIYVPTYDPNEIYGSWPYSDYPPYDYYPTGYVAGAGWFTYAAGVAIGSAFWGDCDWDDHEIHIDVDRYNNFNRDNIKDAYWQHNEKHRGGVPYRDVASAQKYSGQQLKAAQSRDAYRGRADMGQPQTGHWSTQLPEQPKFNTQERPFAQTQRIAPEISPQQRQAIQQRPVTPQTRAPQARQQPIQQREVIPPVRQPYQQRPAQAKQRPAQARPTTMPVHRASTQPRAGAYDGIRQGAQTRDYSNRGAASRAAAISSSGAHRGGGAARGGGARGGGGGRGGGGRR